VKYFWTLSVLVELIVAVDVVHKSNHQFVHRHWYVIIVDASHFPIVSELLQAKFYLYIRSINQQELTFKSRGGRSHCLKLRWVQHLPHTIFYRLFTKLVRLHINFAARLDSFALLSYDVHSLSCCKHLSYLFFWHCNAVFFKKGSNLLHTQSVGSILV